MKHKKIFFISSKSKFDDNKFFDGYAFFGIDLVVGNEGFNSFYKDNSKLNKYEDGNYILLEKVDSNCYKLSRDYHGYYPLFYYKSENYWCISNSLVYIAEHLSNENLPFNYDESNVEIWKSELSFALQLTSHNTFIKEIKVLPVSQDFIIRKDNIDYNIFLENREEQSLSKSNYEDALVECLEVWNSRYCTILSNEKIALHQDLTGGLDSRTIFSFLIGNNNLIDNSVKARKIRINSSPNEIKDLEIAKRLLSLFNLDVNGRIHRKYELDKVTAEEAFAVWKYFNVGRYSPIIFPVTDFNPKIIALGGEGGEDNRNFYGKNANGSFLSFYEYVERYRKVFSTEDRYRQWVKQIKQSTLLLEKDSEIDVSVLHYREFRSNAHTSKNPRSRFKFGILGSKYFDKLGQLSSSSEIESGQILYNVIYNNYNKLLYISFDKDYKEMSDENILNLLSLETEIVTRCGKLYIEEKQESSKFLFDLPIELNVKSNKTPLQALRDRAFESLEKNNELVQYYFGKDYVEKCYKKFQEIDFDGTKINLHTKGSFLHALILVGFINSLN